MEKRVEEKFQEKVNLLQAILEETTDTIFVKDDQGRYLLLNSTAARNFGKTPDEMIGRKSEDFPMSDDSRKAMEESDRSVLLTGKAISYEVTLKVAGIQRTLFTTKSPYRNRQGAIIGVIGISRDITDRKLMEEKLRAEHAYRKPIEEAMLAGVAAVDLTGKLIYVNSAFCKMVGWSEQELLGKTPPYPYWVPEEIKRNMESVKNRIVTGNTSEFKTEFRRQNGERFPALIKTAPLTDGYGKKIGFVATVSDITVQKAAEDKMQETFHRLQSIIDGTTDAIYLRDLEGRLLMINTNGAKLFNKSPEEIIGKDLSVLFSSDFVQKTKDADQRTLKTGYTETIENRIMINGVEHVFLTTRGPIRNAENAIIGLFGISHDITDRIMAENRLKSEYAFRKAIENSMIAGIAAVDGSGRMIYVNPAFCQMTGWSEMELLGSTPPFVYWPPEEVQNILNLFKQRLQKGISTEGEMILRRKTEERFPVLILRSPLMDAEGNNLGMLASFYDLTERKRAEQALRQANQMLEQFINACPLSIMVFDSAGTVKIANAATVQIFDWPKEELIGCFNPIVPVEKRDEFLANIDSVIGGNPIICLEARRQKRSGVPIDLNLWAVSFSDENGYPCVLSIAADITEKRRMENEILKIQKLESLGTLAGGIAHDFNNILTAIMGNISLSKSFVESKEQLLSRLNEAERATLRASELSQQLLTFSKGGAPIKKIVSIQKIIEHSVQFALIGSNVQSQLFFQAGLWPIEADEGQMNQVIQNLVINAKQAMPLGGRIRIEAKNLAIEDNVGPDMALRKGDYLLISFQDQGIGIPKEDLSKIFDPYFTTKPKGSGLGLSITHSIIQMHKGYITVESKPRVGTTFFIYLPASPQASIPQEKVEAEEMPRGQGRVLVMDDEESVLNVAVEMLRHLGYEVNLARSGTEAVQMYKKAKSSDYPFDVVITDLTVPGDVGGVETLRRLREIDPQVKVIVSSGYSNDPAMADFKSFGFSDCLKKPYRAFEVSQTLNRVFKTRKLDNLL